MTESTPELSIVSGNPNSMELAAIVAAYKSYLVSVGDSTVDTCVDNRSLWSDSRNLSGGTRLENMLLAGRTQNWVNVHRLRSRL